MKMKTYCCLKRCQGAWSDQKDGIEKKMVRIVREFSVLAISI
jgi:hypothetical protein